jgi:hypothetical protein
MRIHSPSLRDAGIVFVILGAVSLAAGTGIIAKNFAASTQSEGEGASLVMTFVGIPLLVHAAGCFAAGISMIVVGAKKIPADRVGEAGATTPSLILTPSSARLRWTF